MMVHTKVLKYAGILQMNCFVLILLLLVWSLILPINADSAECVNGIKMKQWTDEKGNMHWSGETCGQGNESKEQPVKQSNPAVRTYPDKQDAADHSPGAHADVEINKVKD